ncbi:MAG: hypothetical protein LBU64_00810 [Planctomycetota bacterium]|jgi:hypothetical protein|nr:hypothetical protein [Planctomycetota bacterium]
MTKLSATLAKKVPIPGLDYSSQQFSCGLEIELSGETSQDGLKQSLRRMYAFLREGIDQEIRESAGNPLELPGAIRDRGEVPADPVPARRWEGGRSGQTRSRWESPRDGASRRTGGGTGPGRATQAQVKAVFGIAKANGMERRELFELLREQYQLDEVELLSVKQASRLIETLKAESRRE